MNFQELSFHSISCSPILNDVSLGLYLREFSNKGGDHLTLDLAKQDGLRTGLRTRMRKFRFQIFRKTRFVLLVDDCK